MTNDERCSLERVKLLEAVVAAPYGHTPSILELREHDASLSTEQHDACLSTELVMWEVRYRKHYDSQHHPRVATYRITTYHVKSCCAKSALDLFADWPGTALSAEKVE